jgi:hypothetical protein
MVRLSEEMIMARTRVSDMLHVKKLNCWGADLTDISVCRNGSDESPARPKSFPDFKNLT